MDVFAAARGLAGVLLIVGTAYVLSSNRKQVNFRLVAGGLVLQVVFAVFIIKGSMLAGWFAPLGWPKAFITWVGSLFVMVLNFTGEGARFVFGGLADASGSMGFIFAFQVLPTIIFFASLMSVLYYLGIMQRVVQGMAWVMAKVMGASGAESLVAAANIFVGQTEAPLVIKPYLPRVTRSELLTIMASGMATIAGGVMAAYTQILGPAYAKASGIPVYDAQVLFATHLLSACTMAAPGAMVLAKLLMPETSVPETKGTVTTKIERSHSNIIDAAAAGAGEGLHLSLNVGAMLIAFIAFIALFNYLLLQLGNITGWNASLQATYGNPLGLQLLFGWVFQFVTFAIGVPWNDAMSLGGLIGTKTVLNEFVAYLDMGKLLEMKKLTDIRSIVMATYMLCGFANFSSIAIQIGGIGPLMPERKGEIAQLGLRALTAAALTNLLTAALAGMLY